MYQGKHSYGKWPIEIDGLPGLPIKNSDFLYVSHYQRVNHIFDTWPWPRGPGHWVGAPCFRLWPAEDLTAGIPDQAIFSRRPNIGSSQSFGETAAASSGCRLMTHDMSFGQKKQTVFLFFLHHLLTRIWRTFWQKSQVFFASFVKKDKNHEESWRIMYPIWLASMSYYCL